MASIFQNVFGGTPSPPPTQINIKVSTSSTTLHKHDSTEPFTLTLEETLPERGNVPNKPLTILTFDTLLDPNGNALYGTGIDIIDSDTGTRVERITLRNHYTFGDQSGIPIDPQYERYFVTLEPGTSVRGWSEFWVRQQSPAEDDTTADGESTLKAEWSAKDEYVVAAAFSHVTSLNVGSTYRVELGSKMSQISWYRTGSKEEVLRRQSAGGRLLQTLIGPKRHHERVGDSEMQAIPLVMQESARFTVEV
ncbi:uncharacterized protein N7484_010719 [Penicillium longicatenatum]|uniref:uncharacterized protein n=1 Tax=Penicillium longicatenatum TaxID=1561947 RepID=UPI0025470CC7|nr:uncharacterized protein N7484_010719 [Penicillium longicatenatum]KAJ5630619.1 hypothetical protein N7484_010719 [Penicillium longicatenatum]